MIELLLQAERALEMGRVDAAESLYHQVADNDPRNAIAVVGLARVALERGDEAGALALARQALRIDPENAAAGRMVARLEEVAIYRGDTVVPEGVAPAEVARAEVEVEVAEPAVPVEVAAPAAPVEVEAPVARAELEDAQPSAKTVAPPVGPPPAKSRRSWLDRLLRRDR